MGHDLPPDYEWRIARGFIDEAEAWSEQFSAGNVPLEKSEFLRDAFLSVWPRSHDGRELRASRPPVSLPADAGAATAALATRDDPVATAAGDEAGESAGLRMSDPKAADEWPWLTVWQVTAHIAFKRTDMPEDRRWRFGPPPWGDGFRNRWGFPLGDGSRAEELWPVRDILYVMARADWWKSRNLGSGGQRHRPPAPLPFLERASIRTLLRRHRQPAAEYLRALRADIHAEILVRDAFERDRDAALAVLMRAVATGELIAWGMPGHRATRSISDGCHRPIPQSFFARRDRRFSWDGWASSGPRGPDWADVRFKRRDVLRIWPASPPADGTASTADATGATAAAAATPPSKPRRNRPGPRPVKTTEAMGRMLSDYAGDPDRLEGETQEVLRSTYGVSRDIAAKARRVALAKLRQNSDRTPIIDK